MMFGADVGSDEGWRNASLFDWHHNFKVDGRFGWVRIGQRRVTLFTLKTLINASRA
jgi:hypothetical protein